MTELRVIPIKCLNMQFYGKFTNIKIVFKKITVLLIIQ